MATLNDEYKFWNDYHGIALLKTHKPTDVGVWQVLAADSNCDLGGSHYCSTIGFFEGSLSDVVAHAVTCQGFWSWGAGEIKFINVTKLDKESIALRTKLLAEKADLEARLREIGTLV